MPKKRGNGEGCVFQGANGKWYAKISQPRQIQRTAKSKRHALILLRQLQEQYGPLRHMSPENLTVEQYFRRWISAIGRSRAASTVDSYERSAANYILPKLGKTFLSMLSPVQIEDWLGALTCGGRTRQVAFAVLRAALNHAVRWGVLHANPMARLSQPRVGRKEIVPFTRDECRRILKATRGDRFEAVYSLGLKCGLRQAEIFGLKSSDINVNDASIVIRRSVSEVGGKAIVGEPKTRSSNRIVPVDEPTMGLLISPPRAESSDFLFTTRIGTPMRRSNFGNRHWKPLLKDLGIAHRGFHHTRHTAATLMLSAGIPVVTVAGILGHSNSAITAQVYAHYLPAQGRDAVATISNLIDMED